MYVLHIVLDQLATQPFNIGSRHNGDCQHHDHVDKLVDDDVPKRRRE